MLANLLKSKIKTAKNNPVLEFSESQWLKAYIKFNTQKRVEAKKNMTKIEKGCTH